MKQTKWILACVSLMLIAGLTISSCKKKAADTEEINTSVDNASAEHITSDVTTIAAQASDGNSSLPSYKTASYDQVLAGSCATVAYTAGSPVITVTFTPGATCIDGRNRSGSLTIDYSASTNGATHYRDPGFSCKITSSNYVVDGNQVNIINKTVTNTTPLGFNPASTQLSWSIKEQLNIVKNGGGTINWNCSRTKYLLNTSDTSVYHGPSRPISWSKARIGHEGTSYGTSASGIAFNATIMNMIIRDFGGCSLGGRHPIIQGTIDFTPSGHPTRVIDYGNGSCDMNATVTVNGVSHPITLP
ncbi:MAG TPA: hypothetical protein VGO45_11605 [Bacteroidia bacterium]|jgi:hypothetical protein|nr:hypothetical protein [Bacteroidia bacterium]